MLTAALLMGALTAYYYGLRAGLWAAAGTAIVALAGTLVPGMRWPAYGLIAAAAIVIRVLGARRARPASTVLAVRWLRYQYERIRSRDGEN
jgi:hypothetical protein